MTPTQREAALRLADDMDTPISVWADQVAHLLRELLAEPRGEPDDEYRCGGPRCDGNCCQPVQEPVACQYAKDVAMPEHRCAVKCQYEAYQQCQPEAAGFDHALGAGRFTVVKGAFWWHIRIGDSTNNVGKFHSKMAAENMALTLLTAFRDGAYTQYMISLSQQRKPLTDDQIIDIGNEEHRAMPAGSDEQDELLAIARAVERAHGIGEAPSPASPQQSREWKGIYKETS